MHEIPNSDVVRNFSEGGWFPNVSQTYTYSQNKLLLKDTFSFSSRSYNIEAKTHTQIGMCTSWMLSFPRIFISVYKFKIGRIIDKISTSSLLKYNVQCGIQIY